MGRSKAEWLAEGIEAGWCSDVVCMTHDGVQWTEVEEAEWEDGGDPCCAVVRIDGVFIDGKIQQEEEI